MADSDIGQRARPNSYSHGDSDIDSNRSVFGYRNTFRCSRGHSNAHRLPTADPLGIQSKAEFTLKYFFISAGVVLSSLAVFSVQLGLDNDSGWGPKRTALLVAGIFCLIIGSAIHFLGNAAANAAEKINAVIEARFSRTFRIIAVSLVSSAIVISAYFWFIELEERIVASDYEYYVEMAKSFKNGHLHLELAPPR